MQDLKEIAFKTLFFVSFAFALFFLWPFILQESTTQSQADQNRIAPKMKIDPTGRFVEDELIVKYKTFLPDGELTEATESADLRVVERSSKPEIVLMKVPADKREQIKESLMKNPNVEYAEENAVGRGTGAFGGGGGGSVSTPNDPEYSSQWALSKIMASLGWNYTKGSSSITVAVLDTGVNYNHPDISSRVVKGKDVWNGDSDPMDDNGHGTAVASVIGAITNNGLDIAAVDWNARILAVKAWGADNKGNVFKLAEAVRWVADYSGAKVLNISFSSSQDSQTLRDAIAYAQSKNKLIVAGTPNNEDTNNCFVQYPAAYDEVIAVTGTDIIDNWTMGCTRANSTYHKFRLVSAPARDIHALTLNGGWDSSWWGTSFGTAHTSGVASMVAGCYPDMTNLKLSIMLGSDDLGQPGYDNDYGYGRINLWKALDYYCY